MGLEAGAAPPDHAQRRPRLGGIGFIDHDPFFEICVGATGAPRVARIQAAVVGDAGMLVAVVARQPAGHGIQPAVVSHGDVVVNPILPVGQVAIRGHVGFQLPGKGIHRVKVVPVVDEHHDVAERELVRRQGQPLRIGRHVGVRAGGVFDVLIRDALQTVDRLDPDQRIAYRIEGLGRGQRRGDGHVVRALGQIDGSDVRVGHSHRAPAEIVEVGIARLIGNVVRHVRLIGIEDQPSRGVVDRHLDVGPTHAVGVIDVDRHGEHVARVASRKARHRLNTVVIDLERVPVHVPPSVEVSVQRNRVVVAGQQVPDILGARHAVAGVAGLAGLGQ